MTINQLTESLDLLSRAREDAQRYEIVIQALFKSLPSALLLLDASATIKRANADFAKRFGYKIGEITGTSFLDLCSPKPAQTSRQNFDAALQDPAKVPTWSLRLRHKDGGRKQYTVSARAVDLSGTAAARLLVHCLPGSKVAPTDTLAGTAAEVDHLGATPAATIPTDRPVLGKDLQTLPDHLNCTITRCCVILGVATMAYYDWRSKPDQPVPNRTVALHVRLLDAFPWLAEVSETPVDLQQALEQKLGRSVTLIEMSLLLGMERTSGYRWGRGVQPSEMIVGLIANLVELLDRQPAAAIEHYYALVEAEAKLAGIDNLWKRGAWRTTKPDRE